MCPLVETGGRVRGDRQVVLSMNCDDGDIAVFESHSNRNQLGHLGLGYLGLGSGNMMYARLHSMRALASTIFQNTIIAVSAIATGKVGFRAPGFVAFGAFSALPG